ncbi:MAG: hypothetical protein GY774_35800, partial [Planctomycetes bacterium]|nr:hypothetical protein [Planctomycetota bacterium]
MEKTIVPEQKPIEGSFTEIDDFATMTFSGDKKSDIPEGTFTEVESFTSLPKDLSKDPEFAAIPDLQIPEPDPNIPLKLAAKKTLKDVRDTINATSETILSTGSGILLFGPSKLYGLAALPFGRDAAKRAEEEMMSLGYQPRTPQGKAAADLIAKGFDLFLTPSKMAEEELSKVSPRAGHLLGLGGELVQLALTGTVAKGVKSTVGKGKAPKTSKVAAPLDATLAKDIVQTRRAKTKVAGGERPLKKLSRQEESLAADTAPTRIRQAVETFEAAMEGKLDLPEIGEKLSKQRQRTKIETQVEKDFQKFGKTVFKDTPVKRSEVKQTIKAVEQRDLGLTPKTTEQIAKEAIEELSTQKKSEKAVSDQRKIVQKAIKDIDSDVAAKLAKKSGVKIILKDLNTIFGEKGAVGDIGKMTKEQRIAVKRLESELTKIKGNAAKVNKSVNQYLQDLGTDSAVAKYVDERAQDLPKMVGGINLQRQNIPKTAKEIEKDIADTRLKETITWQDTEKRADQILSQAPEIQKTFKDLKKLSGGEFGAKVEAARVVNAKAQVEAGKLAEDFKDGKIEAKDFNNRMRELDNAISFDIVSDIASEQGRAFNLLKKEISGRRLIKSVREVL